MAQLGGTRTRTRTRCVFCDSTSLTVVFPDDIDVPQSQAMNDVRGEPSAWMRYNVQRCEACKTFQNKYLADLGVLYGKNHVAPMGRMRTSMDDAFVDMILANGENIDGILEFGGGNGSLADALSVSHRIHVVDPAYTGSRAGGVTVIDGYVEDVDLRSIDANTVVMSHFFEHIYDPIDVLRKLTDSSIRNVYICHPDFDSYTEIKPYTYNILHCEHTFFVENDFVVALMENAGYRLTSERKHMGYAVMFQFERSTPPSPHPPLNNMKTVENFERYHADVKEKVEKINAILGAASKPVYIWPCSVHTIVLFYHGLHYKKLAGVLDNAPSKTGKYMYGYDAECIPMSEVSSGIVVLNGGVYNKDIDTTAHSASVEYVTL